MRIPALVSSCRKRQAWSLLAVNMAGTSVQLLPPASNSYTLSRLSAGNIVYDIRICWSIKFYEIPDNSPGQPCIPVLLLWPPVMMTESPVETAQDRDITSGSFGPELQEFPPLRSIVSTVESPTPPM